MKKGICCICGKEEELTYEHIPPKSSGNSQLVKAFDVKFLTADSEETLLKNLDKHSYESILANKKHTQYQRGFGRYATCQDCNNRIKAVYDKEYNDLTNWVLQLIQSDKKLISEDCKALKVAYPHEFIPLYFVKCVLSMFAVLYGHTLFSDYPELRSFVLQKDSIEFDSSRYKLYLFFLKSQIIYNAEQSSIGSVATMEGKQQFFDMVNGKIPYPLVFEFGCFPWGFVLEIDNQIKRENLSDMSSFITSNRYSEIELLFNAFEKKTPMPLQFD